MVTDFGVASRCVNTIICIFVSFHLPASAQAPCNQQAPAVTVKHFDPAAHLAHAYVPRDENLAPLAERASQLIEMRKLFRESIPESLWAACEVANLRRSGSQDTLMILTANSAIAAKLKQLCPRLLFLFQKRGWQVNAIKITVQGS